jgi:hypothetical protein
MEMLITTTNNRRAKTSHVLWSMMRSQVGFFRDVENDEHHQLARLIFRCSFGMAVNY